MYIRKKSQNHKKFLYLYCLIFALKNTAYFSMGVGEKLYFELIYESNNKKRGGMKGLKAIFPYLISDLNAHAHSLDEQNAMSSSIISITT